MWGHFQGQNLPLFTLTYGTQLITKRAIYFQAAVFFFSEVTETKISHLLLCSSDLVQQQGLAQHRLFPQRDEQRHPAGKSASRQRPHKVWHHCLQSPTQPHQGAAVTGCIVSITMLALKIVSFLWPFRETSRLILISSFAFFSPTQDDNISGRLGVHLRDLCHVLCPCQFCGFPHPGKSEQGQTHAVHQWSAAFPLLAGQLCLGYGKTVWFSWTHGSIGTSPNCMRN